MADKSAPLILDALRKAVTEPAGLPLHGSRTRLGLFPAGGVARKAAQQCKEQHYLEAVGISPNGNSPVETCAITDAGLAYLLSQVSPRQVLEDLVSALDAREQQLASILNTALAARAGIDKLRQMADAVLHRAGEPQTIVPTNGNARHAAQPWLQEIIKYLHDWQAAHPTEDCALPLLFRQVGQASPELTIGAFHDSLRTLHVEGRIYLHPWTGALHEMSEPSFALLVGHEIAYYASLRG